MSASRKRGVDSLLTSHGKSLAAGGSVAFRLVKGPHATITADPVDPKAPKEGFPSIAKFPESVVKPDFLNKPWSEGRLYQQDIPKPPEDSDDEGNGEPKRRWRAYRKEAPKRQWILQEQVDFLETMVARREKRPIDPNQLSSRYEGLPEHNPSHYVLFMQAGDDIVVRNLPLGNSVVNFAQPAARKTLSLSQAEQVIQDQRNQVRTMHHHNEPKNSTKNRLLNKLKAQNKGDPDEEEGDDVMGDVAFRNRKGGGRARKELLSTLGDGVAVSDDGVLGGTNDAAFASRQQRFGQFKADEKQETTGASGGQEERGADGAAMADDFYQRDVGAEYEELDYDANEQFDDDDVDLGEAEVQVDTGGYGSDEDEDDESEIDMEEEAVSGAEGLATVAGFKLMLAKARGEVSAQPAEGDAAAAASNGNKKMLELSGKKRPASPSRPDTKEEGDHMAKIMAAADKAAQKAKEKAANPAPKKGAAATAASAIQMDENGLRVITQEAVRREIWLNHGQIPMKRLMKIFDVKKKSAADRQNKFREVVKELCTMKTDPVSGRMLVLKQHYSNM